MIRKIIIMGPAHPLRGGGLTTFNHRLAKQFIDEGFDCSMVSFSLQYPGFLFPGKSQFSTEPAPDSIRVFSIINSVNPFNWIRAGRQIKKWSPDLIVVRFWLPFMGPALGTILRIVKANKKTKIVCIADNIIPHEKRIGDEPFTRFFLKAPHAFITMSKKVLADLLAFQPNKKVALVPHPLYDNFGEKILKSEARTALGLDQNQKIILFFGFVRHYKGLNLLLEAMSDPSVKMQGITLFVAGEFYEDRNKYLGLIDNLGLRQQVILHDHFIADAAVKNYLCAADCIVQPYRSATQSGVTPLAYHFETPMIVTNVGGLPDLVPNKVAGLVCAPKPSAIAAAIVEFYTLGAAYFLPGLQAEKKKYSWENLTGTILRLADDVNL